MPPSAGLNLIMSKLHPIAYPYVYQKKKKIIIKINTVYFCSMSAIFIFNFQSRIFITCNKLWHFYVNQIAEYIAKYINK